MNRTWGALSLPLADTNDTDFSSLDPARDILLDLFAAAINAELLPRWPDATAGTSVDSATPVRQKLPFEPEPELLQQTQGTFPLLCVYRDGEPQTVDEYSLTSTRLTCKWGVDYFLGPLDAGRRGKLMDVLQAVGKIIASVVQEGGHSAYATTTTPGGYAHARQVLGQTCGFTSVMVTSFRCGPAQFTPDSARYWACTVTLETTEVDSQTAVYADYVATRATLGTGNADGIVANLVVADTDSADEIWPDA